MEALRPNMEVTFWFWFTDSTCCVSFPSCTLHTLPAQAVKGEACSEFQAKRRARCAHTLLVAILLSRIGPESTASSTGEGGGAGASPAGSTVQRTQELLLKDDRDGYNARLSDMLFYISRHRLPYPCPIGLPPLSTEPARIFTISQTTCTCGGKLLSEPDVDGKLVMQASCVFGPLLVARLCQKLCMRTSGFKRST